MKTTYLAGGCFWGIQDVFMHFKGVIDTSSGYANSNIEKPTYKQVKSQVTGASETVKVDYDPQKVTLTEILTEFFSVIDPTELNKQGIDSGTQYRNGVYFIDKEDEPIINQYIESIKVNYNDKIVTEVLPLKNFYDAEDYHQKYFEKNNIPNDCHRK